jgi:hypothetical protein
VQTGNAKTVQCSCPAYSRAETAVTCVRGQVHLKFWPTALGVALLTWVLGLFFELSDSSVLVFCGVAVIPILFSFSTFFVCSACGGELSAEDIRSDEM